MVLNVFWNHILDKYSNYLKKASSSGFVNLRY